MEKKTISEVEGCREKNLKNRAKKGKKEPRKDYETFQNERHQNNGVTVAGPTRRCKMKGSPLQTKMEGCQCTHCSLHLLKKCLSLNQGHGFTSTTINLGVIKVFKPRFCFRTGEASAQRYYKLTLGRKWAAHRQNLWNELYDPTKTKNEIISNVPTGIDRTQWAHFVTYRLKPETLDICIKNKDNRNKQVIPHTGGSKPISRRRHEMFLETGQLPSRGKLYIKTHKRKDGSFVNDAAKAIAEQIEVGLAQSTTNESEVSPNDVVGRVFRV
ncbi:hypothetical protein Fmac_008220 [Flemingia macrophylla]|uniref:HNH homing endonuclease n=1 Tax=Flemingia macrophylla TaxID=520843 RepID=A0ABD1MZ64_9FABA